MREDILRRTGIGRDALKPERRSIMVPRRQLAVSVLLLTLFAPALRAQFVTKSEMSINVQDYGAVPNDGLDDTTAFRNALSALGTSYGRIYVPRGGYNINDTILVANDRINFEGDGPWATAIYFTPSANDVPVFDFHHGTGVSYQCSLRRMSFNSADTTHKKIAIRLSDVSGFVLEDIAIGPIGGWTGNDSIGVQIRGRELSQVSRASIAADMPIKIEHNVNYTGPLEDLDVWHFNDLTLYAASTKYCITADDDTSLTDFVMDGSNDFINGAGGLYWNTTVTSPPGVAYGLTIRNTRSEGLHGGWVVYVSNARSIRNVTLDNVAGGAGEGWKGFYFRNIAYLQLLNCHYAGTSDGIGTNDAVALDIDAVRSVSFHNCFWNGGSVRNFGSTLRRIFAINHGYESSGGVFTTEYWESSDNVNLGVGLAMQVGGGTAGATGPYTVGGSGTIANGATVPLPNGGLVPSKVAYIQVFANGNSRTEGGTALISATSVTRLTGTGSFDVVAGTGKLSIDTSAGWSNVVLRNNTGVELSFGYVIWWI
jgi:hypothetical protein